jgi:Zn-dependent alcohol dehydrogenase
MILGHEAAGVVQEVGNQVRHLKVGGSGVDGYDVS